MANEEKSIGQTVSEIKEMTIAYAKQETIDPLKGLGRYVGYGLAGSLALAVGIVLLGLGVLRFLQTETGTALTGNWSWVPYLAVLVFYGVLIALALAAIKRKRKPS